MIAYAIDYNIRGKDRPYPYSVNIDARDLKSAKKKLGRKHGYKDGRMIKIQRAIICGYY